MQSSDSDQDSAQRHALEGERLYRSGRPISAIREFEMALQYAPESSVILHFLTVANLAIGRIQAGLNAAYRAHLAHPDAPELQARLLVTLLYVPETPPEAIFDTYAQWGKQFVLSEPPALLEVDGKLRIGYFGSNFCEGADVFCLEPILLNYNRKRFHVTCYSVADVSDDVTARLEHMVDRWRNLRGKSEEEVCQVIRDDSLHILVDCSGHFAAGYMRIFASHLAPIQISLSIYPATTGLRAVQYRITDEIVDPRGSTDHLFTEKLLRLRSRPYCCYLPCPDSPEPGPLPALGNGFVTFGSFHRFEKVNLKVLDVWAQILKAIPESRLLMHHVFGGTRDVSGEYSGYIMRQFGQRGIDASRVSFSGYLPIRQHLAAFNEIDIMLDPFPYNGMTTTSESLWMGVPVVTLSGQSHASRVGTTLLSAVGLRDWIARSTKEYVTLACSAAADLKRLCAIRTRLRERMLSSPLTDGVDYARCLEKLYEALVAGDSLTIE